MNLEDKELTGGTTPEQIPPATETPQEPTVEAVQPVPDEAPQAPTAEATQPTYAETPDLGDQKHGNGGKRLAAKKGKGRIVFIAATLVMALLLGGYVGLCAMSDPEKSPLPNTHVAGVDLSGLTWEEAAEKLNTEIDKTMGAMAVDFICEGQVYTVPGSAFTPNTEAVLTQLKNSQQGVFLTRGGQYLSALLGASDRNVKLSLSTMPQEVLQALDDWGDKDASTSYVVEEDSVIFTKGRTGRTLDVAALLAELEAQAMKQLTGEATEAIQVSVEVMAPAEPNFEAIRAQIYTEAADAWFDPETGEVVPAVIGRDLDEGAVRYALAETAEGGECRVALILTEPEVTTEDLTELIFRDVLGECTTYVYGTVSRRTNVRLSSEFANEFLLMPGEEFSYATDCGPFTTDRGFMAAPGYSGGKTIDMEGGGVCQTASTIYLAVLRAGLEVVERHAHGYEPAYVPGGLDATVAGTVLDFRFANNTEYPVKIVTELDSKYNLTVKLLGTNVTGTHWEPYSTNRVITQYAITVYEPDENVPQGTMVKDPERTAYNGVSIDSYNRELDAEGNVLQEVYLYRTKYNMRNAVMLYNPADAEFWGIDENGHMIERPEDPENPEDPTNSENPTDPEDPTNTENPTGPEDPTNPQDPTNPEYSDNPEVTPDPGATETNPPAETNPGESSELPEIPGLPTEPSPAPETTPEPPPEETTDQPVG